MEAEEEGNRRGVSGLFRVREVKNPHEKGHTQSHPHRGRLKERDPLVGVAHPLLVEGEALFRRGAEGEPPEVVGLRPPHV